MTTENKKKSKPKTPQINFSTKKKSAAGFGSKKNP